MKNSGGMKWIILLVLMGLGNPAFAGSSTNFRIDRTVVNACGNTLSAAMQLYDSIGESIIGPARGKQYGLQMGFFCESILPAPTPTITPSVTPTVIRQFGSALMHEAFVYAAPNPIRGSEGFIHFELSESAETWLSIYTLHGKLVLSRHWEYLPPGAHQWVWKTNQNPNGVYLLLIRAKHETRETEIVKKIALIK